MNGVAQVVPYLGAYLGFMGQSVELLNSGNPTLTQTGANFFDVISGSLSTGADLSQTRAADALAGRYQEAQFRDLNNGNRAFRRDLLSANRTIWQGSKAGLKGLGNALEVAGAVTATAGAIQDWKKCGCDGK